MTMSDKIARLAYDLMAIPSVTGNERDALIFCEDFFVKKDLQAERIEVSPERFNLLVYSKNQPVFSTILCTHIDTVAPFIEPKIDKEKGILWGRGACDAKGIAASMIFSLLGQRDLGFDDMALLLTVGEETSSDGARIANHKLKNRAKYVVVGEPTDGLCAFGQKGSLVFDLIASGKKAHSALPHLGESAIEKLCLCINDLIQYSWPKDDIFGETLVNFGEISGGIARNILADFAEAKAIMRLAVDPGPVVQMIEQKIKNRCELKILSQSSPISYFVPEGFSSFCAGFGSDLPYLRDVGQGILFGPGSLAHAHTAHEHILTSELEKACQSYQKIMALNRR